MLYSCGKDETVMMISKQLSNVVIVKGDTVLLAQNQYYNPINILPSTDSLTTGYSGRWLECLDEKGKVYPHKIQYKRNTLGCKLSSNDKCIATALASRDLTDFIELKKHIKWDSISLICSGIKVIVKNQKTNRSSFMLTMDDEVQLLLNSNVGISRESRSNYFFEVTIYHLGRKISKKKGAINGFLYGNLLKAFYQDEQLMPKDLIPSVYDFSVEIAR
jgi:hypothetical protein